MHVAINALFLRPPMGGLELYLRRLIGELVARPDAPRLTIYVGSEAHAALRQETWASAVDLVHARRLGAPGVRSFSELLALGAAADRAGADVIHSVAMTGPLRSRARRVVTVADTTWLTHPTEGSLTHALWRRIIPLVARRADEVIAISDTSRADIEHHLGVPSAHLTTTTLGSGTAPVAHPTPESELRARLALDDAPFVLNVGQRGGHRNLLRLIDAMALVREQVPGARLVLPGYSSPELDAPLRARAAELGIADALSFPGFVSDEELDGLYRAATAFAMPSLTEGFGLPVLEAMQRGTPVACTQASAPAEVGGDAAITFDPLRPDDIAAALLRLLTDSELRTRLSAHGLQRAERYTWSACAEQTMAVYRRALG